MGFLQTGVDKACVLGDTHRLRYEKGGDSEISLMEVLQVVCKVDDRPKTDWLDKNSATKNGLLTCWRSWEHI